MKTNSLKTDFPPNVHGCQGCGGNSTKLGPGAGPHAARYDCWHCGRFWRWLSQSEVAHLHDDGISIPTEPKPPDQLTLDLG